MFLAKRNVIIVSGYLTLTFPLLAVVLYQIIVHYEIAERVSEVSLGSLKVIIIPTLLSWESSCLQEEMQMLSVAHRNFISIKPCTTGSAIGCILLKTGVCFFFFIRGGGLMTSFMAGT